MRLLSALVYQYSEVLLTVGQQRPRAVFQRLTTDVAVCMQTGRPSVWVVVFMPCHIQWDTSCMIDKDLQWVRVKTMCQSTSWLASDLPSLTSLMILV